MEAKNLSNMSTAINAGRCAGATTDDWKDKKGDHVCTVIVTLGSGESYSVAILA